MDLIDEAFAQHRQWRETQDATPKGQVSFVDIAYQTWATRFKLRITQRLEEWSGLAGYEAGKLLRSLRDKADQWWYFLDHPEVPPDNNLAERALRLSVTTAESRWGVTLNGQVRESLLTY